MTTKEARQMATAKAPDRREMAIPPINIREATIRVEELSPLIMNQFSEKARQEMRDKQGGKARGTRKAKDPDQCFRDSLYVLPGREDDEDGAAGKYYIPGVQFKKCAVTACRFLGKDLPMTKAKGAFFVIGDPILEFESLTMREDFVRNATGVADLRYRGQFDGWAADVLVSYDADTVSLEKLVELFVRGGYSNGIGDWRPSSGAGGEFGRFRIATVRER
jgi:hypothetical protein